MVEVTHPEHDMHIRIPIGYSATAKLPKKRNAERVHFYEWVDLPIRVIDLGDAPMAVEWRDRKPEEGDHHGLSYDELRKYEKHGLSSSDGTMHTRWFEDAHWWPVLYSDPNGRDHGTGVKTSIEDYQKRWIEKRTGSPLPKTDAFPALIDAFPEGRPLDLEVLRSVEDNTRTAKIAEFLDGMKELIVVEGTIYRKLPEPIYIVGAVSNRDYGHQAVLRIVPNEPEKLQDKQRFWKMTDFGEAKAHAKLYQDVMEPLRPGDVNEGRQANVYLPASISSGFETQGMRADAEKIIEYKHRRNLSLSSLSDAEGLAFFSFRAAFNNFLRDDDPEPLYERAKEYLTATEATDDTTQNYLRMLIERYELRPITGPRGR